MHLRRARDTRVIIFDPVTPQDLLFPHTSSGCDPRIIRINTNQSALKLGRLTENDDDVYEKFERVGFKGRSQYHTHKHKYTNRVRSIDTELVSRHTFQTK